MNGTHGPDKSNCKKKRDCVIAKNESVSVWRCRERMLKQCFPGNGYFIFKMSRRFYSDFTSIVYTIGMCVHDEFFVCLTQFRDSRCFALVCTDIIKKIVPIIFCILGCIALHCALYYIARKALCPSPSFRVYGFNFHILLILAMSLVYTRCLINDIQSPTTNALAFAK